MLTKELSKRMRQLVADELQREREQHAFPRRRDLLDVRASVAAIMRSERPEYEVAAMGTPRVVHVASVLDWMRQRAPKAFAAWSEAFEENRLEYAAAERNFASLSVRSNPAAEAFATWLQPYLLGRMLDIGCGPQPVPIYLQRHCESLIAGIDPLRPFTSHPFVFCEAFAEQIPWDDRSFERVVCATSLDHVFDLDRALDEIVRVLTDDGVFLLWVAFVDGAAPYELDRVTSRLDRFHLFHFDRPWFYPLITKRFTIIEDWAMDSQSHYIALRPRKARAG